MPSRQPPDTQKSARRWREFGQLAAILFTFAFVAGNGTHYLLQAALGPQHVFGSWFRMYDFHHRHPAQYIAIVAFFYAVLVAAWGTLFRAAGWPRHVGLIGCFILILLFSSAAGGALWAVHDMQAGYFPSWDRRWAQIGEYVVDGVKLGWLIVLLSVPFNLVTVSMAYAGALYFTRRQMSAHE